MSREPSDAERLDREPLDVPMQRVADMARYATLLHGVAAGPDRREAAQGLARALGAEDLLMFLRDPELGVLLPAPGFPQTLPDGRAWRTFLDRCVEAVAARESEPDPYEFEPECARARLRPPGATGLTDTAAVPIGRDIVLVLLGGAPRRDAMSAVIPFLPLVVRALEGERAAGFAEAHARIARDAAARADALAGSLDAARSALSLALDESRTARRRLEEQAAELHAANEELQSQSEEIQSQAEELLTFNEELRKAGAVAERAQRFAEEANQSKSEFLAAMSHELRTPLNAIAGYVQLVEMGVHGPVTDAQREALGRVQRSQQYLLSLINDVLNFAKLEAGRVDYEMTDVPLAALVDEVVSMVEPQLTSRRLALVSRVSRDVIVRADGEKLRQILLNLLSNAMKFTEPGGRITVDTPERRDEHVGERTGFEFLRITDTGIGIPREKQDMVFDPFVQVHREPTRNTEGTGLGLSISRDLARGMGGELRVRSVEGEGSAFTLTLPRAGGASGSA